MDHGAIFIGMNGRDADLHIAGGVRTSTVTLHGLSRDLDSLLRVHLCGHSNKKCLARHCQRGEAGHAQENQNGYGYTFHAFLL